MTSLQIANRYTLQSELGAGGMGTVYLGVDNQTQQNVAIKQLKPQIAQPHMIERFRREGEALRELNHPNIVKMLDAVEEDSNHYLVMEYINGSDLGEVIRKTTLTTEDILRFAIDICDALTRAHRLEIIHRDLKPANVLINHHGTALLTDFGVAHLGTHERVTDSDAIIGTIDYLSPEALNGETVDARTDIWAFGVMLFELLAKERPFKGKGIVDVIHAISTQPVPDLEALCPDAPITLIDLVYRMLEKDRDARIPSMRHIGAALEDIQQGRSTSTPPTPRFAPDTPEISHQKKHNLPAQTTEFIGREVELIELDKLLQDNNLRLVTVLAPGGMGKTRLSLQAAQRALSHYKDGVFFVELAPIADPDNVVSSIADAIGLIIQGSREENKAQLLNFLADQNILLVMDNFEHLMASAGLVTEILQAAPHVHVLATSRIRLNQHGETLFHLSGMDFPDWETPEDALNYAAIKLFMSSARRARPGFELTSSTLDYVARICRLVQGMPLGIVLAASWLGMLSIEEVAQELEHGLDFLETDEAELPERQRSIRAVMDYSWNQMTPSEQQIFMKLSIFTGGFMREAASEITGASLRNLMSLVNKSHLQRNADTGRYQIHELLRQFAFEKLESSGTAQATRHAHSVYYLDFLITREADVKGRRQSEALKEIDAENENIKAAWLYAVEEQRYDELEQAVDCLENATEMNFRMTEAIELMQAAINKSSPASNQDWNHALDKVNLRYVRWLLLSGKSGEYDITPLLKAIQRFRRQNNLPLLSFARWVEGDFGVATGDLERALVCYEECIAIQRELNNEYYVGKMLIGTYPIYLPIRQYKRAIQNLTESIVIRRRIGDINGQIASLVLTAFSTISGTLDIRSAEQHIDEAMVIYQRHGKTPMFITTMAVRSLLSLFQDDINVAKELSERGLVYAQKRDYLDGGIACRTMIAICETLQGQYLQGREELTQILAKVIFPIAIPIVHWGLALATCSLGDDQGAKTWLFHVYSSSLKPIYVTSLPVAAILLYRSGQPRKAVEILSFADTFVDFTQWMNKWEPIADLQNQAKTELGAEAYNTAFERGKSLELESVVQQLLPEFGENS